MNSLNEKELIYKSYNDYYYGFNFSNDLTLLELNDLYNRILNSKFSNTIKRKLLSKLKYKLKFINQNINISKIETDLLEELINNFQFKLN